MSDQCPECGSDWDVKLAPGSHASKRGWRYWCGSIYYPDKDGLSTRGVACRRIQNLEVEVDRLREQRSELYEACYDAFHAVKAMDKDALGVERDAAGRSKYPYRDELLSKMQYALDRAEADRDG